ncbi:MAG TPA: sodium:solute symporter [Ignavibacteriaceae bacterium]|nr:sodium:solute symporter [Ignavibacteriaceae bacterium]HRN26712.1 sodium:solute symporter [Ignavibacteriaceae bacterium]HRP91318.1 sodium:solute symporter [Ignavibacteriaceae bacterium]HRQ54383.1 sodium:solute symporter [Ignavibacteriaceae bacterium]
MQVSTLDYAIIVLYMIVITAFGKIIGGKQKTVKDYFIGKQEVPWWAISFSIVAAETSTLTFISIPGLAYLTNLNFLQLTFGYLIGRIIVAQFFLPAYYKGELSTAYSYLQNRFGNKTRSLASVTFLFTRTAADGVRLFATAIPLYLMLDISPMIAIVMIAIVALLYTFTGGLKGVIWVDAIQLFIYIGGAILAGYYLISNIPGGLGEVLSSTQISSKFSVLNFGFENGFAGFFSQPYTLLSGLIGGAFLSMSSHGTDQLIVQRLLAAKNLAESKKAIITTGVIIIFQFALFLVVGVLLYAYYGPLDIKSDEIFSKFIIEVLPSGVKGIIIAGLFAAALSTLAGSITSLSSSVMLDLYIPFKKSVDETKNLFISKMLTIFWAVMLIFSAFIFMESSKAVVELALSIASFTYGGLLGTFLLGLSNQRIKQNHAIAGFIAAIVAMSFIIIFKVVAWTWFILIGVFITLLVGNLFEMITRKR